MRENEVLKARIATYLSTLERFFHPSYDTEPGPQPLLTTRNYEFSWETHESSVTAGFEPEHHKAEFALLPLHNAMLAYLRKG